MKTTLKVCTVLNHVDEREAFWATFEVPEATTDMRYPAMTVGVGRTEAEAIADLKLRSGVVPELTEVEIVCRDNVNIDVHEGGDER